MNRCETYKYIYSYNYSCNSWLLCFQLLFYRAMYLHKHTYGLRMVDQQTPFVIAHIYQLNSKHLPQKIKYLFNNFMSIVLLMHILNINKVQILSKQF